jgi:methylated-DNA-[protein]-cysteine S-methyltransferase
VYGRPPRRSRRGLRHGGRGAPTPRNIGGPMMPRCLPRDRRGKLKLILEKLPSPIGTILLACDGEAIRALDFEDFEPRFLPTLRRHYDALELVSGKVPRAIAAAIRNYFDGDIRAPDQLPTAARGTDFQRTVWAALRTIPAGTTWSYGDLARHINSPKACRAVGLANGSNPIAIVVPCHRVIGANGTLTGYGGGMPRKRWLLRHEGVTIA